MLLLKLCLSAVKTRLFKFGGRVEGGGGGRWMAGLTKLLDLLAPVKYKQHHCKIKHYFKIKLLFLYYVQQSFADRVL